MQSYKLIYHDMIHSSNNLRQVNQVLAYFAHSDKFSCKFIYVQFVFLIEVVNCTFK